MTSKQAGRQRRPWYKQEGKVIRFVDGFSIRHFNPNFDIVEAHCAIQRPGLPSIPKNQIWLDERFEGEKDFLLRVLWFERRCPEAGEKASRAWLNERLAERKAPPTKLDMKDITVRTKRFGKLLVRFVRGEKIRRWWDVWFIFGGHDLIYPDYIPKNEVWIDIRQDPREIKYTLHHELHERKNMVKGMHYAKAHNLATESEQELRSRELVSRRKRRRGRSKPVDITAFYQRDCECGNTSLKSICWYFGKRHSAKKLGKLCGLSDEGIDHMPLAQGAAKTGAHVFMKSEGAINELRRFLEQGYPILIGWWSLEPGYTHFDPKWNLTERMEGDCGHYSVVYHISKEYVWLMDPQQFKHWEGETVYGGFRRMCIKDFLKVWYDTDTDDYRKVERWYMVVNYDNKTFGIPGGVNLSPTKG